MGSDRPGGGWGGEGGYDIPTLWLSAVLPPCALSRSAPGAFVAGTEGFVHCEIPTTTRPQGFLHFHVCGPLFKHFFRSAVCAIYAQRILSEDCTHYSRHPQRISRTPRIPMYFHGGSGAWATH